MDLSQILSPLELWKDFDPNSAELNISHVRTVVDGLVVTKKMYFDAYRTEAGVVRAYAELRYTRAAFAESNGYMPAVMIVTDMYSPSVRDCLWQLIGAGYAVLTVDYHGDETRPRCTFYPEAFSFAKWSTVTDKSYTIKTDPQKTCWYVWTAIAAYAITLLEQLPEVDASRLGVLGIRDGGNTVANLAAFDHRVKCAAIIGNTGWRNYGALYHAGKVSKSGFFDDERAAYNCCVSIESYAQFITKPILWLVGSNDTQNDFDRAFDTFARMPQNIKCALSVSPRADGSIRYEQLGNLRHWFDLFVLYQGTHYSNPDLEAYVSADRQYVRCTAREFVHVTKVDIYYSYNEEDYRIRNWYRAEEINVEDGQWIAALEVAGEDRFIFCFAVVTYDNGVSVATKQIAVRPHESGLKELPLVSGRLIYESDAGFDCFTVVNTGGLFDYRYELEMVKGPFGIGGIQAVVGELATFKLADPRFTGFDGALISITYYAPADTCVTLKVSMLDGARWTDYSYNLSAEGGEVWQKVALSLSDFKNGLGVAPERWTNIKRFSLKRERGLTFLISTLLWA